MDVVIYFLQMCPTYSAYLYVPAGADDNVVRGSAKFRSKGRLPVLSYYYAPKKVSFENVCIRCRQAWGFVYVYSQENYQAFFYQ